MKQLTSIALLLLILRLGGGETAEVEVEVNSTAPQEGGGRLSRIIGGTVARPNEFPWIVRIQKKISRTLVCGGSLISGDVVLTAARCLLEQDLSTLEVIAGEHDFSVVDGPEQSRLIRRGIIHESFSKDRLEHDIALLFLQSNVTINVAVQLARLPAMSYTTPDTAIVAGWGHTSESALPLSLVKASVNSVSATDCARFYESQYTNNVVCYGRTGLGFCIGDTGGPLMCGPDVTSQVVCGIVSTSNGCAEDNFPGVYTKVANYLEWIERRRRSSSATAATPTAVLLLLLPLIPYYLLHSYA